MKRLGSQAPIMQPKVRLQPPGFSECLHQLPLAFAPRWEAVPFPSLSLWRVRLAWGWAGLELGLGLPGAGLGLNFSWVGAELTGQRLGAPPAELRSTSLRS